MRKVLEEVVADVLRMLPPDIPKFNKITSFGFTPTMYKVKRKIK